VLAESDFFESGKDGYRVIGVCGDIPIKWAHLKELPHRGLEVLPRFRGGGLGSFMTELSDSISKRLTTEIGFRPSRLNLLMKQGFYPKKIYVPRRFDNINTEMREINISEKNRPLFAKLIQQYRGQEGEYDMPFAVELARDKSNDPLNFSGEEVSEDQLSKIVKMTRSLKDTQQYLKKFDASDEEDRDPNYLMPGRFHTELSELLGA
jgi:GNAT superfamily N-acetyltransferase